MPTFLLTLLILISAAGAQAQTLPLVRFVVETDNGRNAAEQCREVWLREGPRLVEELVPAGTPIDTVTCLIMESDTFAARFAGTAPDWGVGLAFPGGRFVALDYQRLPAVGRGVREVFLHEMVHALLFQGAGDTWLPTWFHEGCAMRYSGEWRFSDTISLVLDGHVPSLDRLQGRFPASPLPADRAYRTSLLAVNRMIAYHGPHAPGRVVAASVRHGNFSLGFAEATGESLDTFIDDFASSMRWRLGWLVILTRWPTLFVIMGLVFLAGAGRKFVLARRRLAEMADEEA